MESRRVDEHKKSALETIKEQRAALKNFYKLKKDDEKEDKQTDIEEDNGATKLPLVHKNSSSLSLGGLDPSSIGDLDEFIANESYMNILKVENKVLDQLNSSKSEINQPFTITIMS